MAKNPFKKQSIADTLVNVGIGGAANVAADYILSAINTEDSKGQPMLSDTMVNVIKIGVGAVGGSMVNDRYLRAAMDGIAVVGVSNLVSGLMVDDTTLPPTGDQGTSGLKRDMMGAIAPGHTRYKKRVQKSNKAAGGSILG